MTTRSLPKTAGALLAVALAALLGSTGAFACTPAQSTPATNPATGKLEIDLGNCVGNTQAWAAFEGATNPATFYSDLYSNYFLGSLPALAGHAAHWEIRGRMPDARFTSFQTYTIDGKTMGSLFDENFAPTPGNVNWIRATGRYPGSAHVNYRVRVREVAGDNAVGNGELRIRNDMVSASPVAAAALALRIYPNFRANGSVPTTGLSSTDWIARGQVELPRLVYVIDGPSPANYTNSKAIFVDRAAATLVGTLLDKWQDVAGSAAAILQPFAFLPSPLWSNPVRWEASAGLTTNLRLMINPSEAPLAAAAWQAAMGGLPNFSAFPNDATRYLVGGVNPSRGNVLVTRFRMPTFADPDRGDAMLASDVSTRQLRYLSVCLNNTLTVYASACLRDSQLKVDSDGYVTVVLSGGTSAPIGPGGKPAANWMKYSSPNQLVLTRYMLPSGDFVQSPLAYTGDPTNLAALAAFMGPYYSTSRYCSYLNYRLNACR